MDDDKILKLSLQAMSKAFNSFISECMDESGKPKAPEYKALMRARGYLPPYCEHALSKRKVINA